MSHFLYGLVRILILSTSSPDILPDFLASFSRRFILGIPPVVRLHSVQIPGRGRATFYEHGAKSMANVKFQMDADSAKAVQAFLKVVGAQKKMENQSDRTNRKLSAGMRGMQRQGKQLQNLALGYLSVSTAIRTFSTFMAAQSRAADGAANSNTRLERSIRPLLALGNNAGRSRHIRDQISRGAIAAGVSPDAIANSQFLIESALGNDAVAAKAVQEQVQLLSRLGSDMAAGWSPKDVRSGRP